MPHNIPGPQRWMLFRDVVATQHVGRQDTACSSTYSRRTAIRLRDPVHPPPNAVSSWGQAFILSVASRHPNPQHGASFASPAVVASTIPEEVLLSAAQCAWMPRHKPPGARGWRRILVSIHGEGCRTRSLSGLTMERLDYSRDECSCL